MLTFFFLSVFLKMLLYCLYFCFLYLTHLIALAALESFLFFYGFKQFNSNVLGVGFFSYSLCFSDERDEQKEPRHLERVSFR